MRIHSWNNRKSHSTEVHLLLTCYCRRPPAHLLLLPSTTCPLLLLPSPPAIHHLPTASTICPPSINYPPPATTVHPLPTGYHLLLPLIARPPLRSPNSNCSPGDQGYLSIIWDLPLPLPLHGGACGASGGPALTSSGIPIVCRNLRPALCCPWL